MHPIHTTAAQAPDFVTEPSLAAPSLNLCPSISAECAEEMGVAGRQRDRMYWLPRVLAAVEHTRHPEGNRDLVEFFVSPRPWQSAENIQEALRVLKKTPGYLANSYRDYFTGVAGHESRADPMNMYEDGGTLEEPKTQTIFRCFFYGEPLRPERGFDYQAEYVRYDPLRMGAGLEICGREISALAEHSRFFGHIAAEIERFRSSSLWSRMVTLLGAELGLELHPKKMFPEYFKDTGPARAKDAYLFDITPSAMAFLREGYLVTPGPRNVDYAETRNDLASKIAVLSAQERASVDSLIEALRSYEYLQVWAHVLDRYPRHCSLPQLVRGGKEIRIEGGRSPILVAHNMEDVDSIIPHDVCLNASQPHLLITGPNGGGKTQLLLMLANHITSTQRGTPVFASSCTAPEMNEPLLLLNCSKHTESASSFQNEMRALARLFRSLDQRQDRNLSALVLPDEPGRGTDMLDGGPLLFGILAGLRSRGVFAACSTHITGLASHFLRSEPRGESLARVCTINEAHRLVPGLGYSEGIRSAEEAGLDQSIIADARAIHAQAGAARISLENTEVRQAPQAIRPALSPDALRELGIFADNSEGYTLRARTTIGTACEVFAAYAPLREDMNEPHDSYWAGQRIIDEYADQFVELLRTIPPKELIEREAFICEKASGADLDMLLFPFRRYAALTCRGVTITSSDPDELTPEERGALQRFVEALGGAGLVALVEGFHDLDRFLQETDIYRLDESLLPLREFLHSDSFSELRAFAHSTSFEHLTKREPIARSAWANFAQWAKLCSACKDALSRAQCVIGAVNFYAAVGNVMKTQSWTVPEVGALGQISATKALNTQLASVLGKSNVTSVDVEVTGERASYALTGTNGGGKTQYLQLIGSLVFFSQRFRRVPAEAATIGEIRFLDAYLSGSAHQDERSSFQDEALRIQRMIDTHKRAGSPERGIILIDEPFKGTSEGDAVALLLGLMRYFEQRGITLIFTTHFSGIFDYLEKMDEDTRPRSLPLYVDYFSEQDRFQVKPGIGKSSGILVAAEMGLPRDVIEAALEFQRSRGETRGHRGEEDIRMRK